MKFTKRCLLAFWLTLVVGTARSHAGSYPVWFHPANDSDFVDLFNHPDSWATARSEVTVFLFAEQLDSNYKSPNSGYSTLVAADAFRKVKNWGMDSAIETGAVKEWDCTAEINMTLAPQYINNIYAAGGTLRYLALQEPMVSGGNSPCNQSMETTANYTAAFVQSVKNSVANIDPGLEFVEIEPYPSHSVNNLEDWANLLINDLSQVGVTLSGFHLDVDVQDVNSRGSALDATKDLQELQRFFRGKGIPFGIIFWPGYDPINSDYNYYLDTLDWANRVHYALGKPDYAVFESWVTRNPLTCVDQGTAICTYVGYQNAQCAGSGCGGRTMPMNLPDNNDNIYSHTRLIKDGLQILLGDPDLAAFNREYNPNIGAGQPLHHYTDDPEEMVGNMSRSQGWKHEGYAGYIYMSPGTDGTRTPLYRLYSAAGSDHYFTTKKSDADSAQAAGYVYEGIAGYVYKRSHDNSTPLYQVETTDNNGNAVHFYTTTANESNGFVSKGWVSDGIAAYMPLPTNGPANASPPDPYVIDASSNFTLNAEQSLTIGEIYLHMQNDGNLVLYRNDGTVIWATSGFANNSDWNMSGKPTYGMSCAKCYAVFQGDGNLVLYNPDLGQGPKSSYWASNTDGNADAQMEISRYSPHIQITKKDGTILWPSQ